MNLYEKKVSDDIRKWQKEIMRKSSPLSRVTKVIQNKTQQLIPKRIQLVLTEAIKKATETIMFGSGILTVKEDTSNLSLAERDFLVLEKFKAYKKTAIIQGASFGAGGLILGLADFPALLSIKIKFLFDTAKLYGFDTNNKNERLYLLYVFQLAFSSDEHRLAIYEKLVNWEDSPHRFDEVDWEKFQLEYRDYIDFAKMLQLLPVVGALAGAAANYGLMDRLYEYATNCYRMRIIKNTNSY